MKFHDSQTKRYISPPYRRTQGRLWLTDLLNECIWVFAGMTANCIYLYDCCKRHIFELTIWKKGSTATTTTARGILLSAQQLLSKHSCRRRCTATTIGLPNRLSGEKEWGEEELKVQLASREMAIAGYAFGGQTLLLLPLLLPNVMIISSNKLWTEKRERIAWRAKNLLLLLLLLLLERVRKRCTPAVRLNRLMDWLLPGRARALEKGRERERAISGLKYFEWGRKRGKTRGMIWEMGFFE